MDEPTRTDTADLFLHEQDQQLEEDLERKCENESSENQPTAGQLLEPPARVHSNEYRVTMTLAQSYRYKSQTVVSLQETVEAVLLDLPEWHTTKVVPRIQGLINSYESMRDTSRSIVSVRDDVKVQVSMILALEGKGEWNFALGAWYHYKLAQTINEFQGAGKGTRTRHGGETEILDQYVEAEFRNDAEYAKQPSKELEKRRKRVLKRKSAGDKIALFIKEFGLAALLCFPSKTTVANLVHWNQAPLNERAEPLLSGQQELSRVVARHLQIQLPRILKAAADNQDRTADPVEDIISTFPPSAPDAAGVAPLFANARRKTWSPSNARHMSTTRSFRAILSLELERLEDHTIHVVDPSSFSMGLVNATTMQRPGGNQADAFSSPSWQTLSTLVARGGRRRFLRILGPNAAFTFSKLSKAVMNRRQLPGQLDPNILRVEYARSIVDAVISQWALMRELATDDEEG
ncbi:MAG: hypothetical protein M1816_005559 [Peltula sp. TS41687]|nr:MAG: hypothetical protein M1816_005559 [Peltula sp. TS41687]